MTKEKLYYAYNIAYDKMSSALFGNDIDLIKNCTLEVHGLVHPAEVSETKQKTLSDYVFDYMINGNQNILIPRENSDTNLKYAGTSTVPLCWQIWHTYRIEDLVSNILMANKQQIFNDNWKKKIRADITDTGNALELEQTVDFCRKIDPYALREYAITVSKNTRNIIQSLTLEQIKSKVPEEWVMRILEEGGVTTDFRSVWLLVFWGRLTVGGMLLIPMTDHHMMHLPACLDNCPIKFD